MERKIKGNKKIGLLIKEDIAKLFEKEQSPSTFISRIEYKSRDRNEKVMFGKVSSGLLKILVLGIPSLVIVPYSLPSLYFSRANMQYQQKFLQSKEEESRSMLSEFFIGYPKVKEGIQKTYEFCKHIANTTMYAGLTGCSVA